MRFGLGVLNVIKEICFANEIIIFARYILMNEEDIMLAYTYIEHGKFELQDIVLSSASGDQTRWRDADNGDSRSCV